MPPSEETFSEKAWVWNSSAASTFSRPARGEARISQAIAPTKGDRNSGAMIAPSISPFAGMSVRATSQARPTPTVVAIAATMPEMASDEPSMRRYGSVV